MKRTATEGEIQTSICEYLTARHVFFVRLNNHATVNRDRSGAIYFRKLGKYAVPGLADILALKDGHPYFLECKKDGGRISPEQHEFGRGVVLAGGTYKIVYGIEDVQRLGL